MRRVPRPVHGLINGSRRILQADEVRLCSRPHQQRLSHHSLVAVLFDRFHPTLISQRHPDTTPVQGLGAERPEQIGGSLTHRGNLARNGAGLSAAAECRVRGRVLNCDNRAHECRQVERDRAACSRRRFAASLELRLPVDRQGRLEALEPADRRPARYPRRERPGRPSGSARSTGSG